MGTFGIFRELKVTLGKLNELKGILETFGNFMGI